MLASKTISVLGVDEGQAYRREEVAWICANKDCEENKTGRFVEPAGWRWFREPEEPAMDNIPIQGCPGCDSTGGRMSCATHGPNRVIIIPKPPPGIPPPSF